MSDKYSFMLGEKAILLANRVGLNKPDSGTDRELFVLNMLDKILNRIEIIERELKKNEKPA